jgi:hypothetical protein
MFIVKINERGEFEARRRFIIGREPIPGNDVFSAESWYIFSQRLWEQLRAEQNKIEISSKAL